MRRTARPAAAAFLSELAPRWDETLLLDGHPDTHAVIARRSGDRWFLGAIATGPGRVLRVPVERLGLTRADAWIVTDGADGLLDEFLRRAGAVEEAVRRMRMQLGIRDGRPRPLHIQWFVVSPLT